MAVSQGSDARPAPDAAAGRRYALALGTAEVSRYQLMADHAMAEEADLWRLAGIVDGAWVADVGCGPGALLPALADAVGPAGKVTGIDADPAVVAAAREYTAGSGRIWVSEGHAEQTGLPAESLDVVMLRHVLAHNGGREDAIVAHLATLLRPGGCLYLADIDGTAVRIMPDDDADLTECQQRYATFYTRRGNDPRAGLLLAERLRRAGLEILAFRGSYLIREVPPGFRTPSWAARAAMAEAGEATTEDISRWAQAFECLDAAHIRPTLFAPLFVAVGRRHV